MSHIFFKMMSHFFKFSNPWGSRWSSPVITVSTTVYCSSSSFSYIVSKFHVKIRDLDRLTLTSGRQHGWSKPWSSTRIFSLLKMIHLFFLRVRAGWIWFLVVSLTVGSLVLWRCYRAKFRLRRSYRKFYHQLWDTYSSVSFRLTMWET